MRFSFRRAVLAAGLVLALSGAACAQGVYLLPHGQAFPALSGAGSSSAFGVRVADVGEANPAALGTFGQTEVGVSYRAGTAAEIVRDIEVGPAFGLRPQSVAVVLPAGAWAFGVSYSQRFAAEVDYGCIPVMTPVEPDIEPLDFCAAETARLETFSPQVAYRWGRHGGSTLDVGVRLGLGHGSMDGQIGDVTGTFSAWGFQAAAGIRYRTEWYGLAVHYEHALRVEGEMDYQGGLVAPVPTTGPDGEGEIAGSIEDASFRVAAIPARLSFSTAIDVAPTLDIGADLHYAFWQWEDEEQYENQTEVAAWGRLAVTDRALASFGVWMRGRHPSARSVFVEDGRATYLTVGGALSFERLRIDAVVADSHLLSAESHRQTIVKVGLGVTL